MNSEGIAAYNSEATLRHVKNDEYVGAANKNIDGIAMALPIIVWGRVNLHNTRGNGGFVDLLLSCGFIVDVSPFVVSIGKSSSTPIEIDDAPRR